MNSRAAASARSVDSTPRLPDLEILPMTPKRMPDLAALFARGDPRSCWCTFYRFPGSSWQASTPESNRAELERAVRTAAREKRAPGLIAYRDAEPVGGVSLGPREDYQRLERSPTLHPVGSRRFGRSSGALCDRRM